MLMKALKERSLLGEVMIPRREVDRASDMASMKWYLDDDFVALRKSLLILQPMLNIVTAGLRQRLACRYRCFPWQILSLNPNQCSRSTKETRNTYSILLSKA